MKAEKAGSLPAGAGYSRHYILLNDSNVKGPTMFSAISEPLRMAEKKSRSRRDLLLDGGVQREGSNFRQVFSVRGWGLSEGLAMGSGRMQKKGNPVCLLGVSCCWRDAVGKD